MTLERINTIAAYVLIAALLFGLGVSFLEFFDVGFWRHDSMYYETSYLHKLSEEGRWLNYLLSPLLRLVPPIPAIAFVFFALFGFCYIAMHRFTASRSYSVLVALLAESKLRSRSRYTAPGTAQRSRRIVLRPLQAGLASAWCTVVFLIAFAVPAGVILVWSIRSFGIEFDQRYWQFAANSLMLSIMAAYVGLRCGFFGSTRFL